MQSLGRRVNNKSSNDFLFVLPVLTLSQGRKNNICGSASKYKFEKVGIFLTLNLNLEKGRLMAGDWIKQVVKTVSYSGRGHSLDHSDLHLILCGHWENKIGDFARFTHHRLLVRSKIYTLSEARKGHSNSGRLTTAITSSIFCRPARTVE